jgi:hypothetical protein
LQGGDSTAVLSAGLPNITGNTVWSLGDGAKGSPNGAFVGTTADLILIGSGEKQIGGLINNFNASRSSTVYGASTTVQPPAISLIPQIRM